MPQLKAKTYLLYLNPNSGQDFINQAFVNQVEIEYLNPNELGGHWETVITQNDEVFQHEKQMETTDWLLKKTTKTGFFSAFLDNRFTVTLNELKAFHEKKEDWLKISNDLYKLFTLKESWSELNDFASKNLDKTIFVGKNIPDLSADFKNYVTQIVEDVKDRGLETPAHLELPNLIQGKLGNYDFIKVDTESIQLLEEYLNQKKLTLQPIKEKLQKLQSTISNLQSKLTNYGTGTNLKPETKKNLGLLYSSLELDKLKIEAKSKVFQLSNGGAEFVFVAVNPRWEKKFLEIANQANVSVEHVTWNLEIINWENGSTLKPFQGIAQSVGTVDTREPDPSSMLAIFFMVFFAFCLSDAFYGLVISLFTGFFLFFRKLKPQFLSFFTLFFYSGLVTIVYGVITNSWAGDFFASRLFTTVTGSQSVNNLLSQFQLLAILPPFPEDLPPVNQVLADAGDINPIIALMVIALCLGFLNAISGYVLRIIGGLKSGDYGIVLATTTWLVFLASGIFWIVAQNMNSQVANIASILLGVVFLGILFFNEGKGFVNKIMAALFGKYGAYGIVQLGADLVSFTRIIAIGLTGGVIASIVNLLAFLAYDGAGPFFGIIFALLILVVGHLFNFVLSAFGAYINPLRLTYVEFLPKFFEGRGRAWKGLNSELKYINLVK